MSLNSLIASKFSISFFIATLSIQVNDQPKMAEKWIKNSIKKFPGTAEYWKKTHHELLAIVKQKGAPTHFFTQSCADLYDPLMKKFLHANEGELFKKVAANPHIIDQVFFKKLHLWIEHYINEHFDVSWLYTRNM